MEAESAGAARARLRWAVNTTAWQPQGEAAGDEWRFLLALLPAVRSSPPLFSRCASLLHPERARSV